MAFLYQRYKTPLYNFFMRMLRNEEKAADLLMSTFERVIRYKHSYKTDKKFKSWLYQIANNVLKDEYSLRRKRDSLSIAENQPVTEIIQSSVEQSERNTILYNALNQLSERDHRAVTMYYLLEMGYPLVLVANIGFNSW